MNQKEKERLKAIISRYPEFNCSLFLSYPVESSWKNYPFLFAKKEEESLQEADLYLHYPFCDSICYFCCCDKLVSINEDQKLQYLDYLEKELTLRFSNKPPITVKEMHWGGGTPTSMNLEQIEKLFKILQKYFDFQSVQNLNIEAFPDVRNIKEEKLKLLRQLGFHSISFGIQDFDEKVQGAIHRKESKDEVEHLIHLARDYGFEVRIDLCYGLPYQRISGFMKSLQLLVAMKVDKIVIYPYVHYPYLYPAQSKIPFSALPEPEVKFDIMHTAIDFLKDDYEKFGIDTFVRKESEAHKSWKSKFTIRNFMGTNTGPERPLLGIGMSAISKNNGKYMKNVTKLMEYENILRQDNLPIIKEYEMTEQDFLYYDIIQNQILGKLKIDKSYIEEMYHINFEETFVKELEKLETFAEDGLILLNRDLVEITPFGELFGRCIAQVFNQHRF